ncbi:30S ribosomal protein S4 [Patescibacteria group bacterium]|nr:30S ribosomal protein S4 [Patescibacteria group bacterium]MBU4353575.1 30S ribosomal protein S4 [Patescibacteria group bacterium]MBU4476917.1 30S ribosomal protein S4 [Patescibacteria group bacterium]MCG2699063.1 30S ribosomal protein S4 [Candidatus Parcubacteria bacterium]
MLENKCKKCRRIGEKLFLRGDKCFTPKCPLSRKPYAPGMSKKTKSRRPKNRSEYGLQLMEKQKIKLTYGIRERQFSNYLKGANKKSKGDTEALLFEALESRLDNVVFRLGFCNSRSSARQIVSHGHIMVNGRKVNVPSCKIKSGDKICIRPQSAEKAIFKDIDIKIKKYNPPAWIKLDKAKKEGEIISQPSI